MRVYAYVTNECCTSTRACAPGTELNGRRISKHGDYSPWYHGKRETLAIIDDPKAIGHKHRSAAAVAGALGWN